VQDASLQTVGKVLDRMAELRTMAADITKNSGDIENYTKEFVELQSQLNQINRETFNGISLFSQSASAAVTGELDKGTSSYLDASGNSVTVTTFSRQLITHPDGQATDGSISLNVVNLQFVLSIGALAANGDAAGGYDLANIDGANNATGTTGGFINSILNVSVGQFTQAIEKLADARAENGAEQNRIMNSIDLLQTNMTNLEAAHGRILDADIALESTRFARHNVLVQASAAMTAQANQLTNVALQLLG
jgi:flagellin